MAVQLLRQTVYLLLSLFFLAQGRLFLGPETVVTVNASMSVSGLFG